jgi:mannose-1-phosphate guanylyltransferase
MKILPVILCGGFGARLWPLSRKYNPKQFLSLNNEQSLFKQTLNRVSGCDFLPPIIVSNQAYKFFVLNEIQNFSALILEQVSRNTAVGIALGALKAKQIYGKSVTLLIMPSDHIISNKELFLQSIQNAINSKQSITLFAVKPTYPTTAYGYIKVKGTSVKNFIEKPNLEIAKKLLEDENVFWNSGILLSHAEGILKSFKKISPKILKTCKEALKEAQNNNEVILLQETKLKELEDISFDCAILEKSSNINCIPMLSPWSDVGDLTSYARYFSQKSKIESLKCSNTTIISEKLVACIGVEDLTIINTKDALLVAKNENLQDIKKIVKSLEKKSMQEALHTSKVYRAWGYYEVLLEEQNHKVKRIFVNPKSQISLQSHNKRAEHWVITEGKADVIINENHFSLNTGEATYIPLKAKHRLSNNTQNPLIVIETQIGSYLEEDDITRYEDAFN